jgi:hypothetical protein
VTPIVKSPLYDIKDTAKILGDLVLSWDNIDFVYETAEALLDPEKPMKAEQEREVSRELINMAMLSLGTLSCIQLSDNLESQVAMNKEML